MSEPGWDLMTWTVAENIERLVTLDIRHHGIVHRLAAAARAQAGLPVAMAAAEALCAHAGEGDAVLLLTGFAIPPLGHGETDGLAGTAMLARVLAHGRKARPVIITEAGIVPAVVAACTAAGLTVVTKTEEAERMPAAALVLPFTTDRAAAGVVASALLARTEPAAAIAIEKAGRNEVGEYHTGSGVNVTATAAKVDDLFLAVGEQGGLTIGVGDQGNELGMGGIREAVLRFTPRGAQCGCPCGKGTASAVPAQFAVIGAAADWGAFGLAAALAHLLDAPDLLPDGRTIERTLWAAVQAGTIDAPAQHPAPAVDGVGEATEVRVWELLRDCLVCPRRFRTQAPERYEAAARNPAMRPGAQGEA